MAQAKCGYISFVSQLGTIDISKDASNFKMFIAGSWYLIKVPFPWFSPLASHSHNTINSVISTAVTTWAIVCDQRSWTSKRSLLIAGTRLGSGRESHKLFPSHIIPLPKLRVNHFGVTPDPLASVPSRPAQRIIYQRAIVRLDGYPLLLPSRPGPPAELQLQSQRRARKLRGLSRANELWGG